jgi:nucleotide-binding universal stress UspA family protein
MLSATKAILCATDGSHAANAAVDFAVDAAQLLKARLVFATVNTASELEIADQPMFWDSTLREASDAQLRQVLDHCLHRAEAAHLGEVSCVVLHGRDVVGSLIEHARGSGIDHMVVGSTGRSGFARILLGSVAEALVRHAHCPVTVIR